MIFLNSNELKIIETVDCVTILVNNEIVENTNVFTRFKGHLSQTEIRQNIQDTIIQVFFKIPIYHVNNSFNKLLKF